MKGTLTSNYTGKCPLPTNMEHLVIVHSDYVFGTLKVSTYSENMLLIQDFTIMRNIH